MNENIINSLEQYVKDVNPQYAILLSGAWGCGKTHFVEKWIDQYKTSNISKSKKQESEINLRPVKVSLFGLRTNKELIDAINRELSPVVFNLKKYGLIAAKVISKATLKTDVFDDSKNPIEVEFNALDALFPENTNVSITGDKLLVLDDMERCKIPIEELFGFVDLLLHKYQCKIIIVGDDTKYEGNAKNVYQKYKEKIIGQTLVVQKDANAAFDAFVDEIGNISESAASFIRENRLCVLDVFEASRSSNLRLLKQSLHQFAFLYKRLNVGAEDYKRELLANYVAISIELHNDSSIDMDNVTKGLRLGFLSKDDNSVYLQSKYQFIEGMHHVHLFSGFNVIYLALKYGFEIVSKINVEIDRKNNKPLYDTYKWYYKMSNNEFTNNTNKVRDYLAAPITDLYDYIVLLYFYCKVQEEKLIAKDDDFVDGCIDKCSEVLMGVANLNDFVPYESCVRKAFSATSYESSTPQFENVKACLQDVITEQKKKLKDNLTNILENLSNDKIEDFKKIISGADPYNHANYVLQSIFDKINVDAFVDGFLSLSNENKEVVCVYIGHRYEQLCNSTGIRESLLPDKDNLQAIVSKLKKKKDCLILIDKFQVRKFIAMIEDSVGKLQESDVKY